MIGATSIHTAKQKFPLRNNNFHMTSKTQMQNLILTIHADSDPLVHNPHPCAGPSHINCKSAEGEQLIEEPRKKKGVQFIHRDVN